MRTFLFLLLFVSATSIALHAQVQVGPEVGLSLSNLKIMYPDVEFKNRVSAGFRGGVAVNTGSNKVFGVQTGLFYYTKGTNLYAGFGNEWFASHYIINTLQVPVYLTFQNKAGRYGRLFAGFGPFFDYHMSGRRFIGVESTELNFGGGQNDDLKNWDCGLGLQAGYKINNGLMFRMQYQLGLTNFSPVRNEQIFSRGFHLTLAYLVNAK